MRTSENKGILEKILERFIEGRNFSTEHRNNAESFKSTKGI